MIHNSFQLDESSMLKISASTEMFSVFLQRLRLTLMMSSLRSKLMGELSKSIISRRRRVGIQRSRILFACWMVDVPVSVAGQESDITS